jgi:hypothetical protein
MDVPEPISSERACSRFDVRGCTEIEEGPNIGKLTQGMWRGKLDAGVVGALRLVLLGLDLCIGQAVRRRRLVGS